MSYAVVKWNPYLCRFLLIALVCLGPSLLIAEPLSVCANLFKVLTTEPNNSRHHLTTITKTALVTATKAKILEVPEFVYIREVAKKMGLRVWLFGGTASSYAHYVMWDLARENGIVPLQPDRFDYDFTNIFRSTQDLDIVVDGSPEIALEFQKTIAQRYEFFLGAKANKWEVRSLRQSKGNPGQPGFKEALLDDQDFNNQNTDSHSVGMIELTPSGEPVIRDLKSWNQPESIFLEDILNNRISFLRNSKHSTTSRARLDENPEILSVIRVLIKAFQYEITLSSEALVTIREIIDSFNPNANMNAVALRKIQETAVKLIFHAVNLEYAIDTLDQLGLRKKLIALGNKAEIGNFAWWLNKEPLRTKLVGVGTGKTAAELKITEVAHATNTYQAYESMVRSHAGRPNVLISRDNTPGEGTGSGEGFYTLAGKVGGKSSGLTVRLLVAPNARIDSDFTINGTTIVFKNKAALTVVRQSLDLSVDDLLQIATNKGSFEIDPSNLALLETLKRRLNAARILDELDKLIDSRADADQEKLIVILTALHTSSASQLVSKEALQIIVQKVYLKILPFENAKDDKLLSRYARTMIAMADTLNAANILSLGQLRNILEKMPKHLSFSSLKTEALLAQLRFTKDIPRAVSFGELFLTVLEWKTVLEKIAMWPEADVQFKKEFYGKFFAYNFMPNQIGLTLRSLVSDKSLKPANFEMERQSMLQMLSHIPEFIEWIQSQQNFTPINHPIYSLQETFGSREFNDSQRELCSAEIVEWGHSKDIIKKAIHAGLGRQFILGTDISKNLTALFLARALRDKGNEESHLEINRLIKNHPQIALFLNYPSFSFELLAPLVNLGSFQQRKEAFFTLSLLRNEIAWSEMNFSEIEITEFSRELLTWNFAATDIGIKKSDFAHKGGMNKATEKFLDLLDSEREEDVLRILWTQNLFAKFFSSYKDTFSEKLTRALQRSYSFEVRKKMLFSLLQFSRDPVNDFLKVDLSPAELQQFLSELIAAKDEKSGFKLKAYQQYADRFFDQTDILKISLLLYHARAILKEFLVPNDELYQLVRDNPQLALFLPRHFDLMLEPMLNSETPKVRREAFFVLSFFARNFLWAKANFSETEASEVAKEILSWREKTYEHGHPQSTLSHSAEGKYSNNYRYNTPYIEAIPIFLEISAKIRSKDPNVLLQVLELFVKHGFLDEFREVEAPVMYVRELIASTIREFAQGNGDKKLIPLLLKFFIHIISEKPVHFTEAERLKITELNAVNPFYGNFSSLLLSDYKRKIPKSRAIEIIKEFNLRISASNINKLLDWAPSEILEIWDSVDGKTLADSWFYQFKKEQFQSFEFLMKKGFQVPEFHNAVRYFQGNFDILKFLYPYRPPDAPGWGTYGRDHYLHGFEYISWLRIFEFLPNQGMDPKILQIFHDANRSEETRTYNQGEEFHPYFLKTFQKGNAIWVLDFLIDQGFDIFALIPQPGSLRGQQMTYLQFILEKMKGSSTGGQDHFNLHLFDYLHAKFLNPEAAVKEWQVQPKTLKDPKDLRKLFASTLLYSTFLNYRMGELVTKVISFGITAADFPEGTYNALMEAAQIRPGTEGIGKRYDDALRQLLKLGFDVNAKDPLGKTALMYAWEAARLYGHRDLLNVQLLIDAGADIHIKDSEGKSIVDQGYRPRQKQ